jgi:hypothetical protein
MPANWPATLPQAPAAYSEEPQPVDIRTATDNGPGKSRRRFTKPLRKGRMEFLLTNAQAVILDNFYFSSTGLNGGAVKMNFTHPWTGVATQMSVTKPPSGASDGPLNVRVSFPVEFF